MLVCFLCVDDKIPASGGVSMIHLRGPRAGNPTSFARIPRRCSARRFVYWLLCHAGGLDGEGIVRGLCCSDPHVVYINHALPVCSGKFKSKLPVTAIDYNPQTNLLTRLTPSIFLPASKMAPCSCKRFSIPELANVEDPIPQGRIPANIKISPGSTCSCSGNCGSCGCSSCGVSFLASRSDMGSMAEEVFFAALNTTITPSEDEGEMMMGHRKHQRNRISV